MAWDYAELSKAAKASGGPEKFVDALEAASKSVGRAEGRSEMLPVVGIAALAAAGITAGVFKVVDYFKKKKEVSQAAVEEAKKELVEGIKKYDAEHPDNIEEKTVIESDTADKEDIEDGETT